MVCQGTAKCGASPSATCSSLPMSTASTNCGPLAERRRAVDTIIRNYDRVAIHYPTAADREFGRQEFESLRAGRCNGVGVPEGVFGGREVSLRLQDKSGVASC